jgi:hypothetical protein
MPPPFLALGAASSGWPPGAKCFESDQLLTGSGTSRAQGS